MPFNLLVKFQLFLEYNKLLFFLRSKSSSRMALSHRDEGVVDGSVSDFGKSALFSFNHG